MLKIRNYWKRIIRPQSWLKNEEGVTAVEFGLVAGPFLFMILGILELTMFFTAGSILEGMAQHTARIVRTGQLQGAADARAMFTERMCEYNTAILNCDDVQFEVFPVPEGSFLASRNYDAVFDADGNLVSRGIDPGNVSDVVIIRLVLPYRFKTPLVGQLAGGVEANSTSTFVSTIVLKNEPYEFEG